MGHRWSDGYSADVEIFLLIDDQRHDVAQIGAGSLILRRPREIAPDTTARLIIRIDGREDDEQVLLPDGAGANGGLVPFF